MKDIRTVGIVGLGALGTLYADTFTRALGKERVEVLANAERAARYRTEGVWFNGQLCDFRYADAARETEAPDLLLFAVKFGALEDAIAECRHLVGPDTVLISILNGISSEQILSDAFGAEKVVWCVAQKMAAKKEGNRAVCDPKGELAIGVPAGADPKSLRRLTAFFDSIGFPYSLPADIRTHMWSKLLCNTGCNQATLAFQCGYGGVQVPEPGPGHHARSHAGGGGRGPGRGRASGGKRTCRAGWPSSTPSRRRERPPCGRTARPAAAPRWSCSRAPSGAWRPAAASPCPPTTGSTKPSEKWRRPTDPLPPS
jgi:hypothetical protein